MLDRLMLDDERVESMARGIEVVAGLDDLLARRPLPGDRGVRGQVDRWIYVLTLHLSQAALVIPNLEPGELKSMRCTDDHHPLVRVYHTPPDEIK